MITLSFLIIMFVIVCTQISSQNCMAIFDMIRRFLTFPDTSTLAGLHMSQMNIQQHGEADLRRNRDIRSADVLQLRALTVLYTLK